MAQNIFVGGLPYETTQDELTRLFAAHGRVVSVKIILDRETGRSKGFGFVEMAEASEAQAAIGALHGKVLGGRRLVVNAGRPAEPRPRSYTGPERRSGKERRQGWTPSDRRDSEKKPWEKKKPWDKNKPWGQKFDRRPGADGEKKGWVEKPPRNPNTKTWGEARSDFGLKKPGFGPAKPGFGPKKPGGFKKKPWSPRPPRP